MKYDLILATTPLDSVATLAAATNHLAEKGILVIKNPGKDIHEDLYKNIIITIKKFEDLYKNMMKDTSTEINQLTKYIIIKIKDYLLITNLKDKKLSTLKTAILIDEKQSDPRITAAMTLAARKLNPTTDYLDSADLDKSNITTNQLLILAGIDPEKRITNPTKYNDEQLQIASKILDYQYDDRFITEWNSYWNYQSETRELINQLTGAKTDLETLNFATGGWLKCLATNQLQLLHKANQDIIKELVFLESTHPQIDAVITKTDNQIITFSLISENWHFEQLVEIGETAQLMGANTKSVIIADFGSGEVTEGLEMHLYYRGIPNTYLWSLQSVKDIEANAEYLLND